VLAKAEKENVEISRRYEVLPKLSLDPELIKTCIFNIVLNAFQAMPGGGKLSVSAKASDSKVSLIFEDTGIGLSKENLSRVFDPFFSTKETGLGLGLAMTRKVVEEHGGKVDFQSAEGKGSTITMSFPVSS
jgi:two-component system sensor histidine kinase AtoS